MPSDGYTECSIGRYRRKHSPWVNFPNVSPLANRTFAAFPSDYTQLPTVAFVIPDMCNDTHDCGLASGDSWLRDNLGGYMAWAQEHRSLLILTWDEGNDVSDHIATMMVGQMIRPGASAEWINHYSLLRTIEDMYDLPHAGEAALATPIESVWSPLPEVAAPPAGAQASAPAAGAAVARPPAVVPVRPRPVKTPDLRSGCVVPRTRRLQPATARRALRAAGCRSAPQVRRNSTVPRGLVIGTRPSAGTTLPLLGRVTAVVSAGPARRRAAS
jgi:hypothetical protein